MNHEPYNTDARDQNISKADQAVAIPTVSPGEVLISRIIDGEASPSDRAHFENLANHTPQLWRTLAMRQQDAIDLAARISPQLDVAESINLPFESASPNASSISRWINYIGWAAAILISIAWFSRFLTSAHDQSPDASHIQHDPSSENAMNRELSADEHFAQYVKAPFVIGELPPTLLRIEDDSTGDGSSGRKAMYVLRRIQEVVYLNPQDQVPVDSNGTVTQPLEQLRRAAQQAIKQPPQP